MKKFIYPMVGTMFIFMICWTAIYFRNYTIEDIPYVHLDLQAMFIRFKISWTSHNIYDLIKTIFETTDKMSKFTPLANALDALTKNYGEIPQFNNDFIKFVVNTISIVIDPIFGIFYSAIVILNTFNMIVQVLFTIFDVIMQCLAFAFQPIFIDTRL